MSDLFSGNPFSRSRLAADCSMSLDEKGKYTKIFHEADSNRVGFLTGVQAKEIFMKSGLSNVILAHIWFLSDTNKDGRMALDEFCFAMHLIHQTRQHFLEQNLASTKNFQKMKMELGIAKECLSKDVESLKNEINASVQTLIKNEAEKEEVKDEIKLIKSNTRQHKSDLDNIHSQLVEVQSSIKHFENLIESHQLKTNFSKQERVKLKNYLENLGFPGSNLEDFKKISDEKRGSVIKMQDELRDIKNSLLIKTNKLDLLTKECSVTKMERKDFRKEIKLSDAFLLSSPTVPTQFSTLNVQSAKCDIPKDSENKISEERPEHQEYIGLLSYSSQFEDELSFEAGDILWVSQSRTQVRLGFVKAALDDRQGWVPESHVCKFYKSHENEETLNDLVNPAGSEQFRKKNETNLESSNYSNNGDCCQKFESPKTADVEHSDELRRAIINELVSTEETYVSDLSTIFEVFHKTMKSEKLMTTEEIKKIFSNLELVMQCNRNFLKALQFRLRDSKFNSAQCSVGDVIYENLLLMDPYISFCSSHHNSNIFLQNKIENDPKFKEVHKKMCNHHRATGLPLSSFLLKPVQRITRYPLLIEKLLKCTPVGSEEFEFINKAKNKAVELCSIVNEATRERQNSDHLSWIQSRVHCEGISEELDFKSETNCLGPRKYLHSGSLYKVRSNKELMGILFTDFILLTQPNKPINYVSSIFSSEIKKSVVFKLYRDPVLLNEVTVLSCSDETNQPSFKIVHLNKTYHFKTVNNVERDTWIKKIELASKHFCEVERKKKGKSTEVNKKPVGRLLVSIQEGSNLVACEKSHPCPYCEVKMGIQEQRTKVASDYMNPKWNTSMQFFVFNIQEDVLSITVFAKKRFSPNGFLGRAEVAIRDIVHKIKETKEPLTKHLLLHEVDSGEISIKLDLQIYDDVDETVAVWPNCNHR